MDLFCILWEYSYSCALDKFGISRGFGIGFNFTPEWHVKSEMFNIGLKMPLLFHNTPAFTLIVFVLQISYCYGMKYLVLLLLAIALRIHPHVSSMVQHSH